MKVVVVGASGLIGSEVVARLRKAGHEVTPVYHRRASKMGGHVLDLATASEDEWSEVVQGKDAIANCAGVFQDSTTDSTDAVHRSGLAILVRAAEKSGARRFVHLSAMGMDRAQPTPFSKSKFAGEQVVEGSSLEWLILRPSVVLGRSAYGGSALIRGLAALPLLPRFVGARPIQPVQLNDVANTIVMMLENDAPSRVSLDLAGPDVMTLEEVVGLYRRWLGRRPATSVSIPSWMLDFAYAAGDVAGWMGWRPPVRSTARIEMQRGATGDNSRWTTMTNIEPQSVSTALESTPASVQEKWFANLFLLKPVIFAVFSLFWIMTGLISLGPGWDYGMAIMREGGASPQIASLAIIAGALADIAIGLGIAFRRTARLALWAAIGISIAYAIIGTILVPRLWLDPLGPMLKIWPIIVLNMVALAILEDR